MDRNMTWLQKVPRERWSITPAFDPIHNPPPISYIRHPKNVSISRVMKKLSPRRMANAGLIAKTNGGGGGAEEAVTTNPHLTLPHKAMSLP